MTDYIFLSFTLFYVANIIVRILGLTWKRFRKSSWDLYSIFSVAGTFITTLLALSRRTNQLYGQLHKFFLVSIALLLIPRNNQLDQLFKTAAASLTAIANLLATWFVLFLVYAIALTQTFGLTRFGSNESGNLNFRNVPKALILLFRMSCGESWNNIMEDFATIQHPNCVRGESYLDGDCGSATWARVLFISWNILSMYIFVSLFVSLIFESFSYVYQRSSGPSVVDRKEIRRFKEAWATFDPDGTGYISKEAFPRLLGVSLPNFDFGNQSTKPGRNFLVYLRCAYTMANTLSVVSSKTVLYIQGGQTKLPIYLCSTQGLAPSTYLKFVGAEGGWISFFKRLWSRLRPIEASISHPAS